MRHYNSSKSQKKPGSMLHEISVVKEVILLFRFLVQLVAYICNFPVYTFGWKETTKAVVLPNPVKLKLKIHISAFMQFYAVLDFELTCSWNHELPLLHTTLFILLIYFFFKLLLLLCISFVVWYPCNSMRFWLARNFQQSSIP